MLPVQCSPSSINPPAFPSASVTQIKRGNYLPIFRWGWNESQPIQQLQSVVAQLRRAHLQWRRQGLEIAQSVSVSLPIDIEKEWFQSQQKSKGRKSAQRCDDSISFPTSRHHRPDTQSLRPTLPGLEKSRFPSHLISPHFQLSIKRTLYL